MTNDTGTIKADRKVSIAHCKHFLTALGILMLFFPSFAQSMEWTGDPQELLWMGIREESPALIAQAVRQGADVNLSREAGTPLNEAIIRGNLHIVALLIENGARIPYFNFPYVNLPDEGSPAVIQYLLQSCFAPLGACYPNSDLDQAIKNFVHLRPDEQQATIRKVREYTSICRLMTLACQLDGEDLIIQSNTSQDNDLPFCPLNQAAHSSGQNSQRSYPTGINFQELPQVGLDINQPRTAITKGEMKQLVAQYRSVQLATRNSNPPIGNTNTSEEQCFVCLKQIKHKTGGIDYAPHTCHRVCLANFLTTLPSDSPLDFESVLGHLREMCSHPLISPHQTTTDNPAHLRRLIDPLANMDPCGHVRLPYEYTGSHPVPARVELRSDFLLNSQLGSPTAIIGSERSGNQEPTLYDQAVRTFYQSFFRQITPRDFLRQQSNTNNEQNNEENQISPAQHSQVPRILPRGRHLVARAAGNSNNIAHFQIGGELDGPINEIRWSSPHTPRNVQQGQRGPSTNQQSGLDRESDTEVVRNFLGQSGTQALGQPYPTHQRPDGAETENGEPALPIFRLIQDLQEWLDELRSSRPPSSLVFESTPEQMALPGAVFASSLPSSQLTETTYLENCSQMVQESILRGIARSLARQFLTYIRDHNA